METKVVFQVANRNNALLPLIVRFLTSDNVHESRVVSVIQGATNEELVSSFTFLSFWFSSTRKSTSISAEKRQTAFYLISLIALKVPPVNLIAGVTEFGWRISQPDSILHELYEPMIQRLRRIREYFRYFWVENMILGHQAVFDSMRTGWRMPGQLMELETDIAYQSALKKQFVRMILDRAPISDIRKHLACRNASMMLTEAVIELLGVLMMSRKATHEQLLYSFSNLFMYIHEFGRNNEIDGQLVFKYLMSFSYISPFCVLAITNHIPRSSYLFRIMLPEELTSKVTNDEAVKIARNVFRMADLTLDSKLAEVVNAVPDIAVEYFLSVPVERETDMSSDASIIVDSHLKGAQNRKQLFSRIRQRQLPTYVIAGLSYQIIEQFRLLLVNHMDVLLMKGQMTENLSYFLTRIFSITSPTQSERVFGRFFDVNTLKSPPRHLLMKELMLITISNLLHLVSAEKTQMPLIRFCMAAASIDREFLVLSRYLVSKILTAFPVRISSELAEAIMSCKDLFILLQYEDGTHSVTRVNMGDELGKLEDFRNSALIKRLPFVLSDGEYGTTIMDTTGSGDVGGLADDSMRHICAVLRNNSQILMKLLAERDIVTQVVILRILAQSHVLSNPSTANEITTKLICILKESSGEVLPSMRPDITKQFPLRGDTFILPVAQYLLGRLLSLGFDGLACNLLQNMASALVQDPLVLHWITRFLRKYHNKLTYNIKQVFMQIIPKLKQADSLFVTTGNIKDLLILLQPHKGFVYPDPEVMVSEYPSRFFHILDFSICSVLLSDLSIETIVTELQRPVFDIEDIWRKREETCSVAAKLAAELTPEIGYRFFRRLMEQSQCMSAVVTARQFLVFSMIDVFLRICRESKEIICGDNQVLEAYMNAVIPSFPRLDGRDVEARELASVSRKTPIYQQEAVVDVVITIYRSLKLTKCRGHIIRAMNSSENQFPPELRSVLATSLDVE